MKLQLLLAVILARRSVNAQLNVTVILNATAAMTAIAHMKNKKPKLNI